MMCWPRQRCLIYFAAALVSLALSFWISANDSVINPDGICYLQSAESLQTQGLHAAMTLCDQAKWPFYSALIAAVAKVAHCSVELSAYLLDALFTLISVLSFIAIIRQLGGSERTLVFAAMTILLAHEFNAVRQYIIRDHGFWAFYLVSLLMLLKYFRVPSWRYALFWSASIILATLFRIEGALFLLLLPLAAFFNRERKLLSFLQLSTITFFAIVAVSVWCLAHSIQQIGRVEELSFQFIHGPALLAEHFHKNATALAQAVLSPYSMRDASLILGLMLVAWYLASVVINLSIIYSILAVYAVYRRLLVMDLPAKLTLGSYITVNLLITSAFLFENMFLSKRYLLALTLVLMLWVPFALNHLFQSRQIRKWPFYLALILIILTSIGGIFHLGHSKAYVRQAGDWLAERAPPTAKIYSNDEAILYYSKHFGNDLFTSAKSFKDMNTIAQGNWKQYDYVALDVDTANQTTADAIGKEIGSAPIKTFTGRSGHEVVIYKTSQVN